MKIDYVNHNLFKRIGLEKINRGIIVHLNKLSIRFRF